MKIVVALGGNALGKSPSEQLELVKKTSVNLVDLVEKGHEIIVTHGNGPQVGMINLGLEFASNNGAGTPEMPFSECGAMSQGYIGYHLEQAIKNELVSRNINKNVATIVTEVLVDKRDSAFDNPTKPVGMFYTKEEVEELSKKNNYIYKEDSGRGYRRVVPSPKPIEIIEIDSIKTLIDNGFIVIAAGGGGIPVVKEDSNLIGVSAVIDKDFTSSLLAKNVNADMLLILTSIDKVYINYNKDNQEALDIISISDIDKYIDNGEFGKGSMLPKIEACKEFVESSNKQAIITSLLTAVDALEGNSGSLIKK